MRICLIAPVTLLLAGIGATAAVAADTRRDCQSWASASGSTKAAIANRIGSEHLLTKAHKLAEAKPGASESLYRSSDIQRLCRRY
jgi:hypothetical protein